MVIWITGYSGAGKTTLAQQLKTELKLQCDLDAILLDGDQIRKALGEETTSYGVIERKKKAYFYAKLAKNISDQGFLVIVATISMFEDVRQWNRKNNIKYLEIFLDVPEQERIKRDYKGIYKKSVKEIVSFQGAYLIPQHPDIIFNDDTGFVIEEMVSNILTIVGEVI
jgi:adenylylsulfate kinase-like enzyme